MFNVLIVKNMEHKISRDKLVQDIRELSNLLEDAHPDPYVNGGGKIGYNRRLQKLIRDVPFDGMTKQEFFFYLQPFLTTRNASRITSRLSLELPTIWKTKLLTTASK